MEMMMEKHKPKSKTKTYTRLITDTAISPIERPSSPVLQEDLNQWEDLRSHAYDIENIYPSAPVILAQESKVDYPIVPVLYMQDNDYKEIIAQHTTELQVDYDSMLEKHKIMVPSAPLIEDVLTFSEVEDESLPNVELEKIYENQMEEEFKYAVQEFRNFSIDENDPFYLKLKQYEQSIQKLQSTRKQVDIILQKLVQKSRKMWTLEKTAQVVKDTCLDGWTVSHTFTNEKAVFHKEMLKELEYLQNELMVVGLVNASKDLYGKMEARIWIRNEIDKSVKSYKKLNGNVVFEFEDGEVDVLCNYLNILFQFHKKQDKVGIVPINFGSEKVAENSYGRFFTFGQKSKKNDVVEEEVVKEDEINEFAVSIQESIIRICVILYQSKNFQTNRRILLHVLRTPGIGSWGANLIKYKSPKSWDPAFIDNYLVCLQALLGPVVELEELLGQEENDKILLKTEMGKLVDEWIVVDDVFGSKNSLAQTILLLASDYPMLLAQFDLKNVYEYVVSWMVKAASKIDEKVNLKYGDAVIKVFALVHRFYLILSRALTIIPKGYKDFRVQLANHLISFCSALYDVFYQNLGNVWTEPIYFGQKGDGVLKSSIRQELDNYYYRVIKFFFSEFAFDVCDVVLKIDLKNISSGMISKLVTSVLNGELVQIAKEETDDETDILQKYILASGSAANIFGFLEKLLNVKNADDNTAKDIIRLCFKVCFKHMDFQRLLVDHVTTVLKTMCTIEPKHIGKILAETRENFEVYQDLILNVFVQLPLSQWNPEPFEVYILESMLKDPIVSKKSTLARYIIDQIVWENARHGHILSECEKQLALTITNVYIDFAGRSNGDPIIYKAPKKLLSIAMDLTLKYSPLAFKKDVGQEFNEWCWKTAQRLDIYSRPNSPNSYPLEVNPVWTLKPFETFDSATLSTLRGQLNSFSLAAYVMLLLSELGHNFDLFHEKGWSLLRMMMEKRNLDGVLSCSFEILQTFSVHHEIDVFSVPEYKSLVNDFWNSLSDSEFETLSPVMTRILSREHYSVFAIKFWGQFIFAKKGWYLNRRSIELLDDLCHNTIAYQNVSQLLTDMNVEYRALIFRNEALAQDSQIAIRTPFTIMINRLFSRKSVDRTFPSFLTLTKGQKPVYDQLYSYVFVACAVEMFAEKDVRVQVGERFLKEKSTDIYLEKPLKDMVIVKLFNFIREYPLDSEIVPLLWQMFFSLYFERIRTPGVCMNQCFGYLFLKEEKKLLSELECYLLDASKDDSLPEPFRLFYQAGHKWLNSPAFLQSEDVGSLDHQYYPALLNSCLSGELFEAGSAAWWVDLITITENFEQVQEEPKEALVKVDSEEVGEICKSIPIIEFNGPIIKDCADLSEAQLILDMEMQVLKSQARYHSAFVKEQSEQEMFYLSELAKLYHNITTVSSTFKKCSSTCPGLSLEFDRMESVIDPTVSLNLAKVRTQVENFVKTDYVDLRSVLASLRIIGAVEWLDANVDKDSKLDATALKFFYECVDLLRIKVNAFPPAETVLNHAIYGLGQSFVVKSEKEFLKLYELIRQGEYVESLSAIFDPLAFPGHFVPFYKGLSSSLRGELYEIVFKTFSVDQWLAKEDPSVELITELVDAILLSLEANKDNTNGVLVHRQMAKSLLNTCPEQVLPETMTKITTMIVNGQLNVDTFKDFLSSFLDYNIELDLRNGYFITLPTRVSRATILDSINCMKTVLGNLEYPALVKFLTEHGKPLRDTCAALFSASSLYFVLEGVYVEENMSNLLQYFETLLSYHRAHLSKDILVPVKEIEEFFSLELFLVEKIGKLMNCSYLVSGYFWRIFGNLVKSKQEVYLRIFCDLALQKSWNDFNFDLSIGTLALEWWQVGMLNKSAAELLVFVLKNANLVNCPPFALYHIAIKLISILDDLDVDRYAFYNFALSLANREQVSAEQYLFIVQNLPDKWYKNLSTTKVVKENFNSLGALISFLSAMAGKDGMKMTVYIDFVALLLSMQSNAENIRNPLVSQSEAFAESKLSSLVQEFLSEFETKWGKESLEYGLMKFILVFNGVGKTGKISNQIYVGISESAKISQYPLSYVFQACRGLNSTEKMAQLCEIGIGKFAKNMDNPKDWNLVCNSLRVPESEESLFVRHCLSHCLIYTLYTHALNRLKTCANDEDLTIVIGEQIGVWIESLKWESIAPGEESKIILILLLFSKILCDEIKTDNGQLNSNRLEAHLPPIADSLYRWSEKKSGTSLWSAFGFGETTSLSPQIRLFCRFTSTFIASRLVPKDDLKTQTSLKERIKAIEVDSDFSQWNTFMSVELVPIYENEQKQLGDLHEIIGLLSKVLFPEQISQIE